MSMRKNFIVFFLFCTTFCCCQNRLQMALDLAGENHGQLEEVLGRYQDNPEKLLIAEFLINNMPAHQGEHQGKAKTDAQVITSEYLIDVVDKTYSRWKNMPWARHLSFDEYLEWILPYRVVETQHIEPWSETLSKVLTERIAQMPSDDDEYNTATKVMEEIRKTLREEYGYQIDESGRKTLTNIASMKEKKPSATSYYSQLLVVACRSVGVPAVLDENALGDRIPTTMTVDAKYKTATQWPVIMSSKGIEEPIANDISDEESYGFFPYDKCPKVYRNTFAMNEKRLKYRQETKYTYPFDLCKTDVTDKYFLTSNLEIPIDKSMAQTIKDKYVYIAAEVYGKEGKETDWVIVDFGVMTGEKAHFSKMGRDVKYLIYGYDGESLVPICTPFVLQKSGVVNYIKERK